ncbi:hypothetical protein ABH991_003880 [Bradyrhizobium ottawaense]
MVVGRDPARHLRQQHGADGDADHADRELVEPVGIIKRRQRAGRQEGRDDGIGEQRHLRAHRSQRRRPECLEETADVFVELQRRKARQAAMAGEIAGQQEILQETGDQDAPGSRMARARKPDGDRQRHHHRNVQEDRGGRGAGKALHHVEHAAIERHQRDQQQIGKGDPGQLDRELALLGIVTEARRQDAHGLRHEQPGDDEQHHLRGQQQREDAVGEQLCRPLPLLAMDMRIGRHPGGVEGALGEDRAEMIGQPQRHEKGIGHGAGTEDRREHDVAGKPRQPREQRVTTDREDASEHVDCSRD